MSTPPNSLQKVAVQRMASGFADVLESFHFESLEDTADSAFALAADLCLSYVNPAFLRFGSENGGQEVDLFSGIKVYIGDVVVGPLRDFYLTAYQSVLDKGERWDHEYECSSPELYRRYKQNAYPLKDGAGLVVVNRLIVESVHRLQAESPERALYINRHHLIVQCSHCRCVQRQDGEDQWVWIPEWVAECPPETTHSLCKTCFAYYYGFLQPVIDEKKQIK